MRTRLQLNSTRAVNYTERSNRELVPTRHLAGLPTNRVEPLAQMFPIAPTTPADTELAVSDIILEPIDTPPIIDNMHYFVIAEPTTSSVFLWSFEFYYPRTETVAGTRLDVVYTRDIRRGAGQYTILKWILGQPDHAGTECTTVEGMFERFYFYYVRSHPMLNQLMQNGLIPPFSQRNENQTAVAILADFSTIEVHRIGQFY